ncbi:sensor histidine kinase [Gracilibacillus timonensis]|uniref:sensor histidine kinase n=1 Tax=Gracilibacillus timonensis TaxID=1816696 RepID=UPI0008251347|nr:HAMP domain-containing sensor histidine kinase [Gracilibacillus timonensis]
MLRNKEIYLFIVTSVLIVVIGILIGWRISPATAMLVAGTGILLAVSYLLLLFWRYHRLQQLTQYLRRIMAGDTSLDVRDNREGDLSIVKNELYKMTRMLSEQQEMLQEDKDQLTDAISDISHQLKTPLTSMTVMADLLSDATLPDPKRQEFTRHLQKQLERMEWLVSSLLTLSKLDAGTVQFAKEKVQVQDLIAEVIAPMEIPMELKELHWNIQGDEQTSFTGDKNWTKEACINLLKNAIEHTPTAGKIDIHFKENTLYTEIIIQDTGKGISKEDLPHIFKRFYKGSHAANGSVGIGLAMSHSIITSQQGDIEVMSRLGEGTSFIVKFYKQII